MPTARHCVAMVCAVATSSGESTVASLSESGSFFFVQVPDVSSRSQPPFWSVVFAAPMSRGSATAVDVASGRKNSGVAGCDAPITPGGIGPSSGTPKRASTLVTMVLRSIACESAVRAAISARAAFLFSLKKTPNTRGNGAWTRCVETESATRSLGEMPAMASI